MPPDVTPPGQTEIVPAAPKTVATPAPPTEPTPAAAPEPPAAPAPSARPAVETSRLHRLLTVGGTILGLFILYEVVTSFVAFTDDAYVRSDLVAVAPQVTGQIIEVHVVDNQDVRIGDKLFTIDPEPFQLVVNQWKAQIDRAAAQLKVAQEELALAQAALQVSTSAHTYAVQEQSRFSDLAKREFAPIAELDRANDELRRSQAEMKISTVAIAKAETDIGAHQAALELARAQLASAQWNLDRTVVHAPNNGAITNLTLRRGDMATTGVPLIGIVDSDAWRIMANYKQYYIRDFKIGDTAWVWLDSSPWHFHKGRITGIARGFSRNPGVDKLLPYVAPTTDWIRLQRRIPVTIVLEELPPGFKLYMGADARTVIFP
jgi:multidrug efflux system membrane fusion protein